MEHNYLISILIILISSYGLSFLSTLTCSILWTVSKPSLQRPKIVCLLSNQGYCYQKEKKIKSLGKNEKNNKNKKINTVALVVIKNWDPFVFGPALAQETV